MYSMRLQNRNNSLFCIAWSKPSVPPGFCDVITPIPANSTRTYPYFLTQQFYSISTALASRTHFEQLPLCCSVLRMSAWSLGGKKHQESSLDTLTAHQKNKATSLQPLWPSLSLSPLSILGSVVISQVFQTFQLSNKSNVPSTLWS